MKDVKAKRPIRILTQETVTIIPCCSQRQHFLSSVGTPSQVQEALNMKPTAWLTCNNFQNYVWPESDRLLDLNPVYNALVASRESCNHGGSVI